MSQILCFGEALIDVFAEKGVPLRAAKTLHPSPGGGPANVAVTLARLGATVGFIGKVGVDDYGKFLIELLAQEGIDTTYFVADRQAPTMLAIVATPSPEEQHFILYNGANTLLRVEELSQPYIRSAKVFVYGSVTLSNASRDAALQAARWSKEAGNHVIFDVNLRPLIWPDLEMARHWIEKGMTTATILKLNDVELEFLTGTSDPERGSDQILEQGVQLCCVSLGAEGTYYNNGCLRGYVPGFSVDVLNTTGCGDAFTGGLAYGLRSLNESVHDVDEVSLRRLIRFANACGALAATKVGAMSGLPTRIEVERLLEISP